MAIWHVRPAAVFCNGELERGLTAGVSPMALVDTRVADGIPCVARWTARADELATTPVESHGIACLDWRMRDCVFSRL